MLNNSFSSVKYVVENGSENRLPGEYFYYYTTLAPIPFRKGKFKLSTFFSTHYYISHYYS